MNDSNEPPRDTSRAAFEAAEPSRDKRARIALGIIEGAGSRGVTRDELSNATGWPIQSVCPLVSGLMRAGAVVDGGKRRPTKTGRQAQVLIARR